MPCTWIKVERRGLPLWVYWLACAIFLIQPVTWAFFGITERSDPLSWMLLGYIAISVLAYWQALRWMRFSVTPLIFVFLFLVSYPARVPLVEQNIDLYTISGGHNSVGKFAFDVSAYTTYYSVSLVGLIGLLMGLGLSIMLFRRNRPCSSWDGNRWLLNLGALSLGWLIFSFGISLICFYLNIGLAGIDQPQLPLHLTGCLNFLRMFVLPVIGWFLFGLAYERRANRLVVVFLAFSAIHGVASVYFTLSKAGLMYAILPLVAYLVMRAPRRALTWKILSGTAIAVLLLLPITYFGAMVLRDEAYYGQQAQRGDAFKRIVEDHVGENGGIIDVLQGTVSAVTGRVTGGDELMAVASARRYPISSVWGLVIGRAAEPDFGGPDMFFDIFNVRLIHEDGKFSGKAFGLFAGLFLSHSYWLVFIGSAFFAGLVVWLEKYVLWHANYGASCGVAFWIGLNVWESTFDNLKFYPSILLCMLVVVKFIKQRRRTRSSVNGVPFQRQPFQARDTLTTTC